MKFKIWRKIIDKLRAKNQVERSLWRLSTSGKIGKDNFPICLSDNERQFLINNIKDAKNYLEFGSGGSTYLALTQTDIPNILSVESDQNWITYLETYKVISSNTNRLNFMYIDIGKTGNWGYPTEMDKKELFPNFSSTPFKNKKDYDVIFVDARFRVACVLQAILNSKKDVKILMHDFNNRSKYHCILDFLDIVDTADTMALFKIKENCDMQVVAALFEEYKYICD